MKTLFSFAACALLVFSCNREPVDPNPVVTNITLNEKSAKLVEGDNRFGLELFQNINSSLKEPANTMISPMSVSLALAMVYNGTDGNTKKQIEEMLHKSGLTTDDINQNYKDLVEKLASHDSRVDLKISNAIFYRNMFPVKADFIKTNQNYYQAEVAGLDFSKTNETLKTVNNWVNDKTNGKIDKILEEVGGNDIMYLLNAIYFNGEWTYKFDSKQTSDQNFTKEDQTVVKVPTMTIENPYKYYSNPTFEMLELPYGSDKFSMLVLLPQSGKKTDDIVSLLTADKLNEWLAQSGEQRKKVYLPKFEFEFEQSLIENLEALGMTDAFDAGKANLSGIGSGNLVISEVKHKSYIKVDERGTEAAAVTSVTVIDTSVGTEPAVFRADHPFVFLIREKDTNSILFMGKVIDPSKS